MSSGNLSVRLLCMKGLYKAQNEFLNFWPNADRGRLHINGIHVTVPKNTPAALNDSAPIVDMTSIAKPENVVE